MRQSLGGFCLFSLLWTAAAWAQNPTASINVDAAALRRAIDPNVYGVAHATTQQLNDLNVPLNRNGGNNTSRYNWQINADNRGFDWYFESIPEPSATAGERGDAFIQNAKNAQAQAMLTIPMVGYVGKLGANRAKLASYSQAKYGAQTGNDWQWFPDAGNGILQSNGQEITWNDPLDANLPADALFQQAWVQHLVNRWGPAAAGGLKYYILDNEHSIWHSTHRDVHPAGATMDEIKTKMLDYAARIKAVDPSALVVGPEEWGWSGYIFSGYDQQYGSQHGWSFLPDRANHGGQDYLPWLLNQLKLDGRHLLDILTVHYYPQGGEFSNDTSASMQQLRNRSTRSLWDPNYLDPTWINDYVKLIPRLRSWADTHYYAGTPIGITEYNWGAEGHINGATTQADILGIFGREGLDLAARWTTPDAATPTYKAMKMYRNYDGNKSAFGDVSVKATGPNPDNVAAFAAERTSDGALTVMVIAKYLSGSTPVNLALANFPAGSPAQVWQLTSSNTIARKTDLTVTGGALSTTVPQQSITLFVIPRAQTNNQPPVAAATAIPSSGVAPLAVNFSGTGSSDPDGTIASYAWNFGDGSSGTGATVGHTYQNPGTYTATLTVTDNGGAPNSTNVTVTATADPDAVNAPSGLTGSGGKGKASLSWTDNSTNETGFQVERASSSSGPFTLAGTTAANVKTFSQTGLARATYWYRVRAVNSSTGRVSAYSNTVQVRVR